MGRRSQIAETQPRIIVAWADEPVEVDFREGQCITSAVLQPNSDRSAGLLHLRRGDRIGAVIGGVIGAWPVVTGKPHAAERRIGRRAIGGPVPVDRKSVVSGKSVSVRVDLGGRRIIKKKKAL